MWTIIFARLSSLTNHLLMHMDYRLNGSTAVRVILITRSINSIGRIPVQPVHVRSDMKCPGSLKWIKILHHYGPESMQAMHGQLLVSVPDPNALLPALNSMLNYLTINFPISPLAVNVPLACDGVPGFNNKLSLLSLLALVVANHLNFPNCYSLTVM